MEYIFIGRFRNSRFVDVVALNDKEKAEAHYQKMLSENPAGYDVIELLEQTSTHSYTLIEKNENWIIL